VKEVADRGPEGGEAAVPAGYLFDPNSGYYHNVEAGMYYDSTSGGFFSSSTNKWYSFDGATQQYVEWPGS
jgi:CD2 antigen cytoplasmic tail-binding protein 2